MIGAKGDNGSLGEAEEPNTQSTAPAQLQNRKEWHLARRARGLPPSTGGRVDCSLEVTVTASWIGTLLSSYCSCQLPNLTKPSLPVGLAEAAPSCLLTDRSIKDEHYTLIQELLRLS